MTTKMSSVRRVSATESPIRLLHEPAPTGLVESPTADIQSGLDRDYPTVTASTASHIHVRYSDGSTEVITYASADQADTRRSELLMWASIDARRPAFHPRRVVAVDAVQVTVAQPHAAA